MSDIEALADQTSPLFNDAVRFVLWENVTVTIKDRQSKRPKDILNNVCGLVQAGELLAIMGPSGSGKSTLLNKLAYRPAPANSTVEGKVFTSRTEVDPRQFRSISAYVEQQDALIGSLTVRETLEFAARLSLAKSTSGNERRQRVNILLKDFGLSDQADDLIGTSIRKGISGGQKRRVSVAAQLITAPKIIFLDEPTSGLDSAAAFEVVNYLKSIARRYKLIVIASLHQPSTSTFAMFDKLLLLSQGRTAYSGGVDELQAYFEWCGYPIPDYMNPAEFALDFVNVDFARDKEEVNEQLDMVHSLWSRSQRDVQEEHDRTIAKAGDVLHGAVGEDEVRRHRKQRLALPLTLVHRSFIKSYRDFIAYGIRIAMYLGLALMMGTVWLRLAPIQENIQSFINAIFFGGAFMSFMAVAYIPAFLEDHAIFIREQANGLYGPSSFMVANFIVGIPYLFATSLVFSLVIYWLSNFRSDPTAFFTWVGWLFLDLIAAESLVVLISSLMPIFVVALAATAFANGLWMCTGGFLVPIRSLNAFWRYTFHYIDYQAYVFQGMMINEFGRRNYTCASVGNGSCNCMYESALADQCLIEGRAVLESYGFGEQRIARSVGAMFAIIVGFRALSWMTLYLKTHAGAV